MKPRWHVPTAGCLFLLVSACILVSCASRTQQKEDPWAGSSRSSEFEFDRTDALLETAHQARMEGDYMRAESNYRQVYNDTDGDEEKRALALFGLAETFAALTNPQKDFNQALALYRTLLAEFPGSELRLRAERRVKEVKEMIGTLRETE